MNLEDLKTFLYPLNNKDAAVFLGISETYMKKIMAGDRPINDNILGSPALSKNTLLTFFRYDSRAKKSRNQVRNKSYKEFVSLMGDNFNKCMCCLHPAHQSIYGRYICEQCIDRLRVKTVETNKEDLTED